MKWLREAISDEAGLADMAYIAIGALMLAAIASIVFIFVMSAMSFHNCFGVAPCVFDPLPVGQSVGLIFGAFGALIGALAGYMVATRRPKGV